MIPKPQALALLRDYLLRVEQIRAFTSECRRTLGNDPEAPLHTHLHLLIDPMGECVEHLVTGKPNGGWIQWYLWENDCGNKGLMAGSKDHLKPICTAEDLYWVMNEC